MTPNAIAADYRGKSPLAHRFTKEWQERNEIARLFLEKAAKRMKKWADEKRRPRDFRIGDLVLIKIQADKVHAFRRNVHRGLIRRYDGPYPIIERIGKAAYRVQLPPKWKMHPVFHPR